MNTASNKAKGRRLERRVASTIRGFRTPLSGAAGGNDVTTLDGSLWACWGIETKAGQAVPKFFEDAYRQAQVAIPIGSPKRPAVVLHRDRGPTLFVAELADVASWVQALAEVGNGHAVRRFIQQARAALNAAEGAIR